MGKIRTASADAGNNALKLAVEDSEPVMVPSEYYILDGDNPEQFEQQDIPVDQLIKNLNVTINSRALPENNKRYLIGETLVDQGIVGTEYEEDSNKSKDITPVLQTLSALAVDAMKLEPKKDHIKITYDLSIALPLRTISQETARIHSERFIGNHEVIYHHPSGRNVTVEITIEFCKCIPEGAAGAWGVVYDKEGNVVTRKVEINNEVQSIDFTDKRILHFDIGAGTSELVVTDGVQFNPAMSKPLSYGTKKTINDIIQSWNSVKDREIDGIAEYNSIYFDTEHVRHRELIEFSRTPLKNLASRLVNELLNHYRKLKDDPYTFIYGGGSIILKTYMEEVLNSKGKFNNIIFLNDPIYVNAKGLLIFALSPVYGKMKKDYLQVKK